MLSIKYLLAISMAVSGLVLPAPAQSTAELQTQLAEAQKQIESLKAQLEEAQKAAASAMRQAAAAVTREPAPFIRPIEEALTPQYPLVTSHELTSYAAKDASKLKQLLSGKPFSVTGDVDRFADGVGRKFKVFLDATDAGLDVGCDMLMTSSVESALTAEDGAEMIVNDAKIGRIHVASIHDQVIITGFLGNVGRRHVALNNCILKHVK